MEIYSLLFHFRVRQILVETLRSDWWPQVDSWEMKCCLFIDSGIYSYLRQFIMAAPVILTKLLLTLAPPLIGILIILVQFNLIYFPMIILSMKSKVIFCCCCGLIYPCIFVKFLCLRKKYFLIVIVMSPPNQYLWLVWCLDGWIKYILIAAINQWQQSNDPINSRCTKSNFSCLKGTFDLDTSQ